MCEMSFSKDRIIEIAMRQSAIDAGCEARDFLRTENITVISAADRRARKYLELPFDCNLISYGSNIVSEMPEFIIIAYWRQKVVSSLRLTFPVPRVKKDDGDLSE